MSSSASQWISVRLRILIVLVVSCSVIFFFVNYKPDIEFRAFHQMSNWIKNYSCPINACPVINQTQDSTANCPSQLPPTIPTTESDTILLIWMYPFGSVFDLSCHPFNIKKCHLTDDKSMYDKAHGVLFHNNDINRVAMPAEPRPWFQKWVWFNMESPTHTTRVDHLKDAFNLTCTHRLDSSIPVPYGHLEPVTPEDESFKLPEKNKLVCWIVSNWNPNYKRVQFYNELKEHVRVETYGNAFGKSLADKDYENIVSSCKFYLSFENTIYTDYITEKMIRPMILGTVPVVLGPPRQNYERQFPGDSFIHIDDFSTPKELAERLLRLDQNDSEYMRYFDWRKRYKAEFMEYGRSQACETCRYLQNNKGPQVFPNLDRWYWGS